MQKLEIAVGNEILVLDASRAGISDTNNVKRITEPIQFYALNRVQLNTTETVWTTNVEFAPSGVNGTWNPRPYYISDN